MSMNDDIKTVLVSEEQLKAKVAELGARISKDYEGKNLVLVSILLCWLVAIVTAVSGIKYLWDNRSFINTAK